MADYENQSGSVSQDIEQGTRKAVEAGKTAAQAGKAIGKAAAGDVAGAIKDVASSEGLRKFVAVILCISVLFTILIFFAAPMAIYEGVKAYFDTLKERWLEEYYGANTGRALAALKATLSGAWDIIKDFWNMATAGLTKNDTQTEDTDKMTGDDITIMGPKNSLVSVYTKKLQACIDKIQARENQIESSIYASANGSIYDTGTINGWIYNNLYNARDYWTYANLADTRYVNYAGVTVTSGSQPMTMREAVKVVALYSAMYNCDVDLIKPYSLMKWLGYYTGGGIPMNFTVGNAVTCSVRGWEGEFMPMYLVEEFIKNGGDYKRYQCPAADILLIVSSDPLASLTPHVEKTKIVRYEHETGYGYGPQYRLMSAATYRNWSRYQASAGANYGPNATSVPYCRYYSELQPYYRGSLSYSSMINAYNAGTLDWYMVYDYYYYDKVKEIIEYDYTLSYTMNASVSLRSADTIAKLAGFYEKESAA